MTGKELKSIRRSLGLTQADFAALVGVAPNSIARQERGEMGIREPLSRLVRLIAKQMTDEKEGKRRGKKS
jgi:transcriptional regulator with XRE-family HTH domain